MANFEDRYKMIISDKFKFTTISPPYTEDYESIYKEFQKIMVKYRKYFTNLVGCVEFSDNERIHFHMVYNFSDSKVHYYFINKALRGLKWNVLVLNIEPKDKYQYLTKENDHTSEMGITPMFDEQDLEIWFRARAEAKMMKRMAQELDDERRRKGIMYYDIFDVEKPKYSEVEEDRKEE